MRFFNLIWIEAVCLSLLASCCKEPYPVAGITVYYPNLSNPKELKAIRTDKNNFSNVIDTISLGELNTSNSFSAMIEFANDAPNYILYMDSTTYKDTISEIIIERKGCNEKIKTFQYRHNGLIATSNKLIIE